MGTGSAATSKSKYNDTRLQFLDESFAERVSRSSLEETEPSPSTTTRSEVVEILSDVEEEKNEEDGQDESQDIQVPRKRQKLNAVEELRKGREERMAFLREILPSIAKEREQHPVRQFFDAMASSVISLPPHLIREAKIKILEVVTDLEEKASLESSSLSHIQGYISD
ncbi:hypothetical protein J437_LFUL003239 [Ladona fulva]|uniref:BESS domain-containing protein n=1 Tax=Ladona fulva TaxID=123851 RepID=A0A8K0JX71_LADFU|nr:hypothetical protein J437_LFUL003239 [Ladona fulva]